MLLMEYGTIGTEKIIGYVIGTYVENLTPSFYISIIAR